MALVHYDRRQPYPNWAVSQSITRPGCLERNSSSHGRGCFFESIGSTHIRRSREALRSGGKAVAYGLSGSLPEGRSAPGCSGGRRRFRAINTIALYIAAGLLPPGRRRVVPYSTQWLKRLRPAWFGSVLQRRTENWFGVNTTSIMKSPLESDA